MSAAAVCRAFGTAAQADAAYSTAGAVLMGLGHRLHVSGFRFNALNDDGSRDFCVALVADSERQVSDALAVLGARLGGTPTELPEVELEAMVARRRRSAATGRSAVIDDPVRPSRLSRDGRLIDLDHDPLA